MKELSEMINVITVDWRLTLVEFRLKFEKRYGSTLSSNDDKLKLEGPI
jgi:hypothetical protein